LGTFAKQELRIQRFRMFTVLLGSTFGSTIQGVSEIRVLILTNGRIRQLMKLFSITFSKIRKSFPRFFAPQFLPND
jgi:hypothetical protein